MCTHTLRSRKEDSGVGDAAAYAFLASVPTKKPPALARSLADSGARVCVGVGVQEKVC